MNPFFTFAGFSPLPLGAVSNCRYTSAVKAIRLTRHARNRMRWHQISEDLIHTTLQAPDWEDPSVAGRMNRWKQVADRFLRVTYREELERIIVISAVFKRRPPGRMGQA